MVKSKSRTNKAVPITRYVELERYAVAFAEGHLNLLIICGAPGLGKSRCVRRVVDGKACWIDGNASAFGMFISAFENRDRPIVLDDVDRLCREPEGVRFLKGLCQTDQVKSLSWQTDAPTLKRRGIPKTFTTSSRVAIIANHWRFDNVDVAALQDRGHFLVFEPSAREVHAQASTWFRDEEILQFIADHLHLMGQPSLRTYVLAAELKQAGLDWRQGVLARCLSGRALKVAQLRSDPNFKSEEDRAHAFKASGAGSRATYFNYVKRFNLLGIQSVAPLANHYPTDS